MRAWLVTCAASSLIGCYNPSSNLPAPDAATGCFLTALAGELCPEGAPVLELTGATIDTTNCENEGGVVIDLGSSTPCVILGERVVFQSVRGRGARALVIVSNSTIEIDGRLDVGSNATSGGSGANTDCPLGGRPGDDGIDQPMNGGGGGGGGSFQGAGGPGGAGEKNGMIVSGGALGMAQTLGLRGGCPGGVGGDTGVTDAGAGVPGPGGGAVYLAARTSITLTSNAAIVAGGRGGGPGGDTAGGGGGGGSGGLIAFDAPTLITTGTDPLICANGGGGGGGAEAVIGNAGRDGCEMGAVPAAGGAGGSTAVDGGDGGTGSSTLPAGAIGIAGDAGGGGGGGGAGYIAVYRASSSDIAALGNNVSPPVTAP